MMKANTSAQHFNNETGKMSRGDDFAGILLMSYNTSSSETELKLFWIGPVWTRCWPNMTDLAVVNIRAIVFLMRNSFIWKKSLMATASSLVLQPWFTLILSSCRRPFTIFHVCFRCDATSDKRVFKCAVRESVTACLATCCAALYARLSASLRIWSNDIQVNDTWLHAPRLTSSDSRLMMDV